MARRSGIPFSVYAALTTVAGLSVASRLIHGRPVFGGSRAVLDFDGLLADAEAAASVELYEPQGGLLDRLLAQVQRQPGEPGLLILSNGLGRDSATIIALLVQGKLKIGGEIVKPDDIDLVVFSDPGNEWIFTVGGQQARPQTLVARTELDALLDRAGIRHLTLEKPPPEVWKPYMARKTALATELMDRGAGKTEFKSAIRRWSRQNPPPWRQVDWAARARASGRSLIEEKAAGGGYHTRPPILAERESIGWGTSMMGHACTIAHKIEPINELMEDLTMARWGIPMRLSRTEAKAHPEWDTWERRVLAGKAEPHQVILGMAADEVKRIKRGEKAMNAIPWKAAIYPLAQMGITKQGERQILKGTPISRGDLDLDFVQKSGCMLCHFQPQSYFWALRQTDPQQFRAVERYERRANQKNPKYSIKNVRRITTKGAALVRLVELGFDAEVPVVHRHRPISSGTDVAKQRKLAMDKILNKSESLALYARIFKTALPKAMSKTDAINRLVEAGVEVVPGDVIRSSRRAAKQRHAALGRRLNVDATLAMLEDVDFASVAPILIGELVDLWRAENPNAKVKEVLAKTYDRCGGGMNLCPGHARDCGIG